MNTTIPRLGELLVRRGVLTASQVCALLEMQRRTSRPLGDLAETHFGVPARVVETAWVRQYVTMDTRIDLDARLPDPEWLLALSRRQAWQFGILPLGLSEGSLDVATCAAALPRAARYAWRRLQHPVYFRVARRRQLLSHLARHYPWAGSAPALDWVGAGSGHG